MVGLADIFVEASEDFGRNIFDFSFEFWIINKLRPQIVVADVALPFFILMFFEVVNDEGVCFFVELKTELDDELDGSGVIANNYIFC